MDRFEEAVTLLSGVTVYDALRGVLALEQGEIKRKGLLAVELLTGIMDDAQKKLGVSSHLQADARKIKQTPKKEEKERKMNKNIELPKEIRQHQATVAARSLQVGTSEARFGELEFNHYGMRSISGWAFDGGNICLLSGGQVLISADCGDFEESELVLQYSLVKFPGPASRVQQTDVWTWRWDQDGRAYTGDQFFYTPEQSEKLAQWFSGLLCHGTGVPVIRDKIEDDREIMGQVKEVGFINGELNNPDPGIFIVADGLEPRLGWKLIFLGRTDGPKEYQYFYLARNGEEEKYFVIDEQDGKEAHAWEQAYFSNLPKQVREIIASLAQAA